MNIIIAINEAYIEPAKNMLFSIGCHHPEPFTVYLLHSRIPAKKVHEFTEYIAVNCHGEVKEILVDRALFAKAPRRKWWAEETYYRLIAFDLLPAFVERALWLDADLVVNGNLDEFYNQPFGDNYAVVCEGCNQTLKENLGLPNDHIYFNAGVILYNIAKMRIDFTVQQVFDCINENLDRLKALDQDILNIIFSNHVIYADESIYNHETFGNYVFDKPQMAILHNKAKIIHFDGPVKPWHPKGVNWADDLWWKYELKRRRVWPYIQYRILNLPVKAYYLAREYYYKAKVIIRKLTELFERKD